MLHVISYTAGPPGQWVLEGPRGAITITKKWVTAGYSNKAEGWEVKGVGLPDHWEPNFDGALAWTLRHAS